MLSRTFVSSSLASTCPHCVTGNILASRIRIPFLSLRRNESIPGIPVVEGRDWTCLWIVCFAVLFRGAVSLAFLDHLRADPDAYRAIAETLGRSGVFGLTTPGGEVVATAFRPPLYPTVLSWSVVDGNLKELPIALLHTILGGLTAACTYLASRAVWETDRGRMPGILAALLVIVDPILVQQSTLVMTETMATAIAAVVIWWWMGHLSRRMTLASGIVLGGWLALAYLCRPTFVVWGAMLLIGLGWSNVPREVDRTRRWLVAGSTGLVLLLAVAAWTLRNASAVGHPVWATTHGGYTLLLGNNPDFYRHLREAGPFARWDPQTFLAAYAHRYEGDSSEESFWLGNWDSPVKLQPELSAALTEQEDDELTYQAARATIGRHRMLFAASCLARVYGLWTPFPHGTGERSFGKVLLIGSYYCLLSVAALIGFWRLRTRMRSSVWWAIPTLILTLTLVHAVYWSNMRMRAPAIPAIAIVAASCLWRIPLGRS